MIELNKIYTENCLQTMNRMKDNFIDLVVTSPPYDDLRDYNGYDFDFKPILKELFRVVKNGGVLVWIVGDQTIKGSETGTSFRQALFAMDCGFNLHDTMIYRSKKPPQTHNRYEQEFEYMFVFSKEKPKTFNPIMVPTVHGGKKKKMNTGKKTKAKMESGDSLRYRDEIIVTKREKQKGNIWIYPVGLGGSTCDKNAFLHPAIFPEKLAADHIKSWSNRNDIVYDPFTGSGTTMKMSHLLGRKWIGSEISDKYVKIAYNRLKPYLEQTSLFLNNDTQEKEEN